MSPYAQNIFLILGTTIGAGIFSLPLALGSIGLIGFICIIVVVGLLLARTNSFYREIVDGSSARHQLSGYVSRILGRRWGRLAAFLLSFSICGALLAYLILGGTFLSGFISVPAEQGSYLFFVIATSLMIVGRKNLEVIDIWATVIKVVLLISLVVIAFITVTPASLATVPLVGGDPFVAYGSVLFAMTGISIIPELRRTPNIKRSIFVAQGIIAVLYIVFSVGLFPLLSGQRFLIGNGALNALFNITGFFTVLTPYLLLSWVGFDSFTRDFLFKPRDSIALVIIIPLLLFVSGFHGFLQVISVTGSVFLGGTAILICSMYRTKFPGKYTGATYFIQGIFLFGLLLEIIRHIP